MKQNIQILGGKNKGFSLIEILLVIGFIAVAIAAVFVVYPKVKASSNASTEITNIATITSGLQGTFASSNNYNGLTTATAIQSQVVPSSMIQGTNVFSSFGTNYTISTATVGGVADHSMRFSVSIPKEACPKFLNAAAAYDQVGYWATPTFVKDKYTGDVAITIAETATACAGDLNTIVLVQR